MLFFSLFAAHPQLEYDNRLKSTQTFKAGTTITLLVNVSGIPKPDIKWMFNNNKLEPCHYINIETTDKYSKVTVKNAERKDSGAYTISAENVVGKAHAEFEIIVEGNIYILYLM